MKNSTIIAYNSLKKSLSYLLNMYKHIINKYRVTVNFIFNVYAHISRVFRHLTNSLQWISICARHVCFRNPYPSMSIARQSNLFAKCNVSLLTLILSARAPERL